jgi:hypothetical protein
MDKAAMVSVDVDMGMEIVDTLERKSLKVNVALWAFLSEYPDWRLILSSRQFDSVGLRNAYGLLHDALDAAGIIPERAPLAMIIPMSDPFIRDLRRRFGKAKNVEGMRQGGQMFGDRFIEDAYVYRIAWL